MPSSETFHSDSFLDHAAHCRAKWAWFVLLGTLFIASGVFAVFNVFLATVLAVLYIGVAMIVSGLWEIVTAFQMRPRGRALLWAGVGGLTAFTGMAAARFPLQTAVSLTALIGALLIAAGVVKIALAFLLRDLGRWEVVAVAGALSLLLGALILAEWPASGLYTLGFFLGVNLMAEGFGWVAMGTAARRTARSSRRGRASL